MDQREWMPPEEMQTAFGKIYLQKKSGPSGTYFNKINALFYYEQQISKTQKPPNTKALWPMKKAKQNWKSSSF